MPDALSAAEARRIALTAQGFLDPRPRGRVDARHFRRVLDRMGLVQLDAVNVLVRSHYLPFFARLGLYDLDALDRHLWGRGTHFEFWGHEASVIPVQDYGLFRHRMEARAAEPRPWAKQLLDARGDYVEALLDEIRERGPLTVGDLEDAGSRTGPWWGWSDGKLALEWLFASGRLTATSRSRFQRRYDLPERALPAPVLAAPAPPAEEARRELLLRAARSHGIGTARDLSDYYRLPYTAARAALRGLAAEGALRLVSVEGWTEPAFMHPDARLPRRVEARALLSPFDPVVWERARAERVFDFHYRIEIYTPPAQRRFGYYVLPFLLGDRLVGRVDLKADRAAGTLRVPGAFAEPGVRAAEVAEALAQEVRLMADWLGLERVEVGALGDLARPLRTALATGRR
ncbi:MAG: crosslink repair DNA glycosylase YcaQ family protein [Dehalococcoidia bacterium]|nr:crosslink repair DNA glycosylase YcaQ family protein [Dehalococcoidia bacterium]